MKRFSTPGSYSELVDEILESPHFGERWASHWLDLVRFGETTGYEVNRERPNAFHYRDYVIAAFNQDKPYDVFVKEQIAGDVIWPEDEDANVFFSCRPKRSGEELGSQPH